MKLYDEYIKKKYCGDRKLFYSKTAFMEFEKDYENDLIIHEMFSSSYLGFKKLLTKINLINFNNLYCKISMRNVKHDYIVRMYVKFGFRIYHTDTNTYLMISKEDFNKGFKKWVI